MKSGNRNSLAMICSKFIIGALVLCGIVFSNTGADAKRVGNVIRVGIWDGYKYIDNDTGKFSHCIMGAEFKSGITVFFSINRRYDLSVGFYNSNWALRTNTRYPVQLSVDRSISQNTNATANSKNTIRIVLRNKNAWYAAFRKGRRMRLEAAKQKFHFRLEGTYVALPRILECVDRAMMAENPMLAEKKRNGPKNPFAQKPDNPFSAEEKQPARQIERKTSTKSKQQNEAGTNRPEKTFQREKSVNSEKAVKSQKTVQPQKFVQRQKIKQKPDEEVTAPDMKKFLTQAGLEIFRVLNNKEREKRNGKAHQAWIGNNYFGYLNFTKNGKSASIENMSSAYVSQVRGGCKETFGSRARAPVNLGKINYRQISAKCKREADPKMYYFTFIFDTSGLEIAIMLIADENSFEPAKIADQKLREFFVGIYSK